MIASRIVFYQHSRRFQSFNVFLSIFDISPSELFHLIENFLRSVAQIFKQILLFLQAIKLHETIWWVNNWDFSSPLVHFFYARTEKKTKKTLLTRERSTENWFMHTTLLLYGSFSLSLYADALLEPLRQLRQTAKSERSEIVKLFNVKVAKTRKAHVVIP